MQPEPMDRHPGADKPAGRPAERVTPEGDAPADRTLNEIARGLTHGGRKARGVPPLPPGRSAYSGGCSGAGLARRCGERDSLAARHVADALLNAGETGLAPEVVERRLEDVVVV